MKPLPVSSRISFFYAGRGILETDGHKLVLRRKNEYIQFPVANTNAILIEPGVSVTHAAVKLCAETRTLLLWTGEQGVRLYSSGNPGGSDARNLLLQARHHLDPQLRFDVGKKIFFKMFGEWPPNDCRTIDQIRGAEGSRVRSLYKRLAKDVGIEWQGRIAYQSKDSCNTAISHANAALYGLAEAIIVAIGMSPAIGFVHSGDSRSFVFDIADCLKFKTVVPFAMQKAQGFGSCGEGSAEGSIEGVVRRGCRDLFVRERMAEQIVKIIQELFSESNSCIAC